MLKRLGYLGMQESRRQWWMWRRSWMIWRLQRSLSLSMSWQCLRHSQPSPPSPVKLCSATLQTRSRSNFSVSWTWMESTSTRSPGFLLASQVKPIPEKAEYLPARLGYMETLFSSACTSTLPGTSFTTTLSVITFSMTPKVMGPALMQVSILKLPLFIIAMSAPVSCRQIETRNSAKGVCCLRMVQKRRSMSLRVKHATFSCFSLNYLQMSSMQWLSSGSGSICSRSWWTSLSSISNTHCEFSMKTVSCLGSREVCSVFLWSLIMEKFLKSVPLLTSTESLTCSCTIRWSCPPRMRSMPLTCLASLMSLYFIMCVSAMTRSQCSSVRSLRTIWLAKSMKGMYSQICLQQGQSVSIHSSSARLNTPIFSPFLWSRWYSSPSASRRWVRRSQTLLSSQGKPVRLVMSITCSSSQSRSWLPQQARSIPKACSGLTMFSPSNSVERREGEKA